MGGGGGGAVGGWRGRWMDRHTDPNRFAHFGWGVVGFVIGWEGLDLVTFDSMNPTLK